MGPFAVVDPQPSIRQRLKFSDRLEEMRVEHFTAKAAIEPFDVRVLIRLAGLDVVNRRAVFGTPIDEGLGREFRAVVPSEEEVTAGQVLL